MPQSRRGRALPACLLVVAALMWAPFASPASSQVGQGVGLAITPIFPPLVTVGATGVLAELSISNNSVGVGPVTLTNITLNPTCGDPAPGSCAQPDLGVFALSGTGIGILGACAGMSFTISGPSANGTYTFTPANQVVLQPPGQANSGCVIDFTFNVLKAPAIDASAGNAGIQTRQFATVSGEAITLVNPTLLNGTGTGTSITTVQLALPEITTVATPATTLSLPISDTATVTGPVAGPTPTGNVTFTLYGPDNPTCAGPPIFQNTASLTAGPAGPPNDATATSAGFTPNAPGSYNWIAVYNGDANYIPATSPCGAPNETSLVVRPAANINTVATPSVAVGSPISDTATVTGLVAGVAQPTGTVTFNLYSNATCTGPAAFTSTNPLVNGVATSGTVIPNAGVYNWVATYNGDSIYLPVSAACGAPNETSTVLRAQPAITTEATQTAPLGSPIQDVATLSGTVAPAGSTVTGTITFSLYGPNDLTCAGAPVFTSPVPVTGNGPYTSAAFTPTLPGTYQWIASYGGDVNNLPVTAPCGAPNETTRVLGPPTIQVVKTATPETRLEPGGLFTFTVVVTNTSANPVTITSLVDVREGIPTPRNLNGQGTCAVGAPLAADPDGTGPLLGGSYTCAFTHEFLGNAGDSQDDVVTAIAVDELGQEATDDDDATVNITDVAPNIQVVKDATPETLNEPGGTFTFTVTVTNTSIEQVTITDLLDDKYPNIKDLGNCTTAVGTILAANGGTYTCSFPGVFNGTAGATQTDIVTVIGVDDDNTEVSDTDDATVGITNVLPTVEVIKTATPETRPAPGGDFTFNVVVRNTSTENVTITTLTDDIYGNIANQGTCKNAVGQVLAPQATYSCSFTGRFEGASGSQRDVVTVVVIDDDGSPASDTDDATVTITPAVVLGQTVNTVTETPTSTITTNGGTPASTTRTLPKTGAGVFDLLLMATGLLVLGGFLLLTANRWAPAVQLVPLFGASGVVSGRIRRLRHRRSRPTAT